MHLGRLFKDESNAMAIRPNGGNMSGMSGRSPISPRVRLQRFQCTLVENGVVVRRHLHLRQDRDVAADSDGTCVDRLLALAQLGRLHGHGGDVLGEAIDGDVVCRVTARKRTSPRPTSMSI